MSSKISIVSVDGNIGSGKSTLLSSLRKYYNDINNDINIVFLDEPVDEWEKIKDENGVTMLEKFYSDPEKYSFSFQIMAYISRLKILRKAVNKIKNNNSTEKTIIITERSLYTDKCVFAKMLYDTGKIETVNYQIYLSWFDTFTEEFPLDKIIYVKTNPEICYSRINKRAREGEENIPLQYLTDCDKYHEDMIENLLEYRSRLTLNGNIDMYVCENHTYLEGWLREINNFIQK
jgi:deoxyadenosine/deoxycytidine kinase